MKNIFSSSKLFSCIIEYYLSYLEGIKIQKYNVGIVVGSLFHKGMELYIKDIYKQYTNKDILFSDFQNLIKKYDIDTIGYILTKFNRCEVYKNLLNIDDTSQESDEDFVISLNNNIDKIKDLKAKDIVDKYLFLFNKAKDFICNIIKNHKPKQVFPELLCKREINDIIFYGIPDLMLDNYKNEWVIIDYKTSKNQANKFQIYFYGYISLDIASDKISLFYLYPAINKISHTKISKNNLLNYFEPYLINRANAMISLKKILNINKVEFPKEFIDVLSDTKLNLATVDKKLKEILPEEYERIMNNVNLLSALTNDYRLIEKYDPNNIKCRFCNFKNICSSRNVYSKIIS